MTASADDADVAAVVATVLVDGGHAGRKYVVTGPEALTPAGKVRAIGTAIGREIAAGVVATRLMRRAGEGVLVGLGMAAATAGFIAMMFPLTVVVLTGAVLVGVSLPWISIGITTFAQRSTPPDLMGRTAAAISLLLATPQTLAIGVGAALIAVLDYRVVLLVMTSLTAVGAGYLLTRREQRPRPGMTAELPVGTCRDR